MCAPANSLQQVRVHASSWLDTGDLALWQLESASYMKTIGCRGALIMVVLALAGVFSVAASALLFSTNEVKAAYGRYSGPTLRCSLVRLQVPW